MKHIGGNMLLGCFAAVGTGAHHKTDIIKKEHYQKIFRQHLRKAERKLKLGHK